MLSNKFSILLLIVVVSVAGFVSWTSLQAKPDASAGVRSQFARTKKPDAAGLNAATTDAESMTLKATPIPTAAAAGEKAGQPRQGLQPVIEAFTEPYRDIAVAAAEMGTLADVSIQEGDTVKAGDMIATLDEKVLRASLDVARRSMTIEGTLKSAQADLEMKTTELEKMTQLHDRNHASQQEVDRVQTELRVAEARLLSVREDLEVKHLEFRRIEAQIEQRAVRSPIAGIVSEVQRESGEFVSPSDPIIARIVQLDPLLIVFSVPLSLRNEIARDQVVGLEIGDDRQSVEGTVEYVAPTPDSSNSSVRVKVRLANPDRRFQSGERTVLIPRESARIPATAPSVQSDSSQVARRAP